MTLIFASFAHGRCSARHPLPRLDFGAVSPVANSRHAPSLLSSPTTFLTMATRAAFPTSSLYVGELNPDVTEVRRRNPRVTFDAQPHAAAHTTSH